MTSDRLRTILVAFLAVTALLVPACYHSRASAQNATGGPVQGYRINGIPLTSQENQEFESLHRSCQTAVLIVYKDKYPPPGEDYKLEDPQTHVISRVSREEFLDQKAYACALHFAKGDQVLKRLFETHTHPPVDDGEPKHLS